MLGWQHRLKHTSTVPSTAVGGSQDSRWCCRLERRHIGSTVWGAHCTAGHGPPPSTTHSIAGHGSTAAWCRGLAACKQRHTAPRSCARSPSSEQPLYLRFPGKQFLFITEKALLLEGKEGPGHRFMKRDHCLC